MTKKGKLITNKLRNLGNLGSGRKCWREGEGEFGWWQGVKKGWGKTHKITLFSQPYSEETPASSHSCHSDNDDISGMKTLMMCSL